MTNMQCNELGQILEQQADGPLPELATEHINGCEACRALTLDLAAIRAVAMELGAEDIAPPEHLWTALRNQLEAEGIIRDSSPVRESIHRAWWIAVQHPALAGAFLSLILVAAGMISTMGNPAQTVGRLTVAPQLELQQASLVAPSAENVFKEELLTVGNENIPGFRAHDAAVSDSIRRNLNIVDNFIAMCEKDVREQPENEMAREYLYGAYEQKAELLSTAMDRSTTGGLQ
jgi:hypothetical protein